MKLLMPLMFAATLLCAGTAQAQTPARAPLVGTWAVDLAGLPMPPEARPRSVTITFAQPDATHWATRVEVVDGGGNHLVAEGSGLLDGTPTAVSGNLEADLAGTTLPAPGVLVMQLSKGGVPGSTRIYTVSADGQRMTETAAYFTDDGKPVVRTHQFTRLR
jgi:hypothetical protein